MGEKDQKAGALVFAVVTEQKQHKTSQESMSPIPDYQCTHISDGKHTQDTSSTVVQGSSMLSTVAPID